VMVVLEEALSGFAIRKPPNDCERLRSPSMASRPRRMWLRPSPFRDPGPTARPRLELGGATVRSIVGFSGVTTILDLESGSSSDTTHTGPSYILAKVTAQRSGLLTQQLKHWQYKIWGSQNLEYDRRSCIYQCRVLSWPIGGE
jgi:hypothetical protein